MNTENKNIPIWAISRVVLVLGVEQKPLLLQVVGVALYTPHSNYWEPHLLGPTVHDLTNIVLVIYCLQERE